jgi:uncharacterized Zn-finger protein
MNENSVSVLSIESKTATIEMSYQSKKKKKSSKISLSFKTRYKPKGTLAICFIAAKTIED